MRPARGQGQIGQERLDLPGREGQDGPRVESRLEATEEREHQLGHGTSNPSSITGNTTVDVDLRFGTRATLGEVTIGTIVCETTVLSRGSTVCP